MSTAEFKWGQKPQCSSGWCGAGDLYACEHLVLASISRSDDFTLAKNPLGLSPFAIPSTFLVLSVRKTGYSNDSHPSRVNGHWAWCKITGLTGGYPNYIEPKNAR